MLVQTNKALESILVSYNTSSSDLFLYITVMDDLNLLMSIVFEFTLLLATDLIKQPTLIICLFMYTKVVVDLYGSPKAN